MIPDPVAALGGKFAEATAYLRERSPALRTTWSRLALDGAKQAFVVAGVAQVDVLTDVWTALERAVDQGLAYETFRAAVIVSLASTWGGTVSNPSARIATIFRTNTSAAYNAGRYRQARHPDTIRLRPYWRYDAIRDGRTTPLCKACDGVTLPADDPWWSTHLPPLHHHCRAGFTTLRASQVGDKDLTKHPPEDAPDGNFGRPPTTQPWRPDPADYPAPLRARVQHFIED